MRLNYIFSFCTDSRLGVRHLQVFLLFLSIVVNYVAKLNVGVTVVAMTNADTTNPDFKVR